MAGIVTAAQPRNGDREEGRRAVAGVVTAAYHSNGDRGASERQNVTGRSGGSASFA